SGMAATVLGAAVATRWFTARRGLVMGVLTASTATGQLVFLPSLAAAAEAQGWRTALLVVAAASVLAVPFILWLMRDDPGDIGARPFGEDFDSAPVKAAPGGAAVRARPRNP